MKNEELIYFKSESEKELSIKILEYTKRVNDLGLKYKQIEKSKRKDITQKEIELKTIDNEAKYYISKINEFNRKLYGGEA